MPGPFDPRRSLGRVLGEDGRDAERRSARSATEGLSFGDDVGMHLPEPALPGFGVQVAPTGQRRQDERLALGELSWIERFARPPSFVGASPVEPGADQRSLAQQSQPGVDSRPLLRPSHQPFLDAVRQ